SRSARRAVPRLPPAGRDQPDARRPAPARRGAPPPGPPPPACQNTPTLPAVQPRPLPARAGQVRHPHRDHPRLPEQLQGGIFLAAGRDIRRRDRARWHDKLPDEEDLGNSSSTGSPPVKPALTG